MEELLQKILDEVKISNDLNREAIELCRDAMRSTEEWKREVRGWHDLGAAIHALETSSTAVLEVVERLKPGVARGR